VRGASNPALNAALAGLLALAISTGIGRFVYTPLLPIMIDAGAFDAAGAGYVAGANYLGYLVGALAASLAALVSRRRIMAFVGLAVSVATNLAMALHPDLFAITSIRLVAGFASAFAMIFTTSVIMRRLTLEQRPELSAVHFAGVGVGIVISAVLVSSMAAAGAHWSRMWLVAGLIGLFLLAGARLLLPGPVGGALPVHEDEEEDHGAGFSLQLWLYITGYGFFGFGYVISATFINALAKSEPALRSTEPWVWTIVGLAAIPSIWFWNRVAAARGSGWAYAAACLVEAIGVGLPVLVVRPAALIFSAVLLGSTFVAITALGLTHARIMAPASPSRAIALMSAAAGTGQMIGPVVGGILFKQNGNLVSASLSAAVALLLAAAFAMAAQWSGQRARA
jgi:predicted MFS family arabinose efflux permease